MPDTDQEHRAALAGVYQGFLGRSPTEGEIHRDLPKLERLMRTARNRPVNFLKHADRDPNDLLNENDVKTDHLLLEACFLCASMGFDLTAEMRAFGRWHLAVYPHQEGDALETGIGPVHELPRESQIEVGAFILDKYRSIP